MNTAAAAAAAALAPAIDGAFDLEMAVVDVVISYQSMRHTPIIIPKGASRSSGNMTTCSTASSPLTGVLEEKLTMHGN